ncbi:MAG TPA: glycine cleavage system aminomethyltransferase GcvT [Candidatus Eremiobacteraeota bacterium]|nr:glycine cleavage system aminomethyltransferase GcvT [Candidatus Eremiobacteraeota bacterium]
MSGEDFIFKEKLHSIDPEVNFLVDLKGAKQECKIIMIASESLCPKSVRETLSSSFTNIYAEGYLSLRMTAEEKKELIKFKRQIPIYQRYAGKHYHKGCDYMDSVEALACLRLSKLFETKEFSADKIYSNVQSLSGVAANNAVYTAFLSPGDVIMSMDLSHEGHLTHRSPVKRSGKTYKVVHYGADIKTGKINFDKLEKLALENRPKIIIAGYRTYPWDIDWIKFKDLAKKVGALLLADIAYIAGPVVAGLCNNPIGVADIISFTTHKTLCGPRGAVILCTDREIAKKINYAIFSGEQGGPHINNVAAKAVAFKLAGTDQFKALQKKIIENTQSLAEAFKELGFTLAYGGTNTHMVLIDLKTIQNKSKYKLDGEIATRLLDLCGIVCNKNTIAGDEKEARPSAIRFGTTWVSQRGMGKNEMLRIAEIVNKILTGIIPYRYPGHGGSVGRGKILQLLMDNVKLEVDSLTGELFGEGITERKLYSYSDLPSESDKESPLLEIHQKNGATIKEYNGYRLPSLYNSLEDELKIAEEDSLIFDLSHMGIIEILGERAQAFLQEITTNNIYTLKCGQSRRSYLFDHNYRLVDDVIIMRRDNTKKNSFLILSNSPNHFSVTRYFCSLSNEYTLFDREELFAKIEGPCVINDYRQSMTVFALLGKKSPEIIKKLLSTLEELQEGYFIEKELEGIPIFLSRSSYGDYTEYQLIMPRKKTSAIWNRLISYGVKPGGTDTKNKLREKGKLPIYVNGDRPTAIEVYEANPGYFNLNKPYFIGQSSIIKHLGEKVKSDKTEFKFEEQKVPLKRTPLFEEHQKLASKTSIVPFAGWEMPVKYSGIKEEHMAVRQTAGLFDVSHMGIFDFQGEDACRFIDLISANYIPGVRKGQIVYSYLLDVDGVPIDDILVYGIDPYGHYMMVVNAANADKTWEWINAVKEKKVIIDRNNPLCEVDVDVEIRNLKDPSSGKDRRVDMALQGPKSLDILKSVIDNRDLIWKLENLKKFYFIRGEICGMDVIISRTGYTGEEVGFEMYVHPDNIVKLWNLLLERGKAFGLKPAALGARDSTRTEAGLPLYGHELAGKFSLTPLEAGYGSFVKFHKPFFVGRSSSIKKEETKTMEIVRFRMIARGIRMVKPGNPVVSIRGEYIGEVTSCALGTDDHQIGLACINRKFAKEGEQIGIFILPPKVNEKQKDKLKEGDKVILHETGEIVSRFYVVDKCKAETAE